jgi:transposase InsO family protein
VIGLHCAAPVFRWVRQLLQTPSIVNTDSSIFFSIEDARRKLERWRIDCNRDRPHSSLGNLAPVEFERSSQKNRITEPKNLNL